MRKLSLILVIILILCGCENSKKVNYSACDQYSDGRYLCLSETYGGDTYYWWVNKQ